MAQKYVVQVVDDLDGTELDQTEVEEIRFGLDGRAYLIDLSTTNATRFRDVLSPYIDAARRDQAVTRSNTRGAASPRPAGRTDLDQVRAWANENGYTVSTRGRVPATVLEAYDQQH